MEEIEETIVNINATIDDQSETETTATIPNDNKNKTEQSLMTNVPITENNDDQKTIDNFPNDESLLSSSSIIDSLKIEQTIVDDHQSTETIFTLTNNNNDDDLLRPILTYGSEIWINHITKKQIQKLESTQHQILRQL